ncbi:MAG: HAD family hydrolase [Blautia sp.]|nr:HAD family hydrolase [Lachnoclostridium sp.]MCM1211306.1 HAD family hydrolase [Blautia sp.]
MADKFWAYTKRSDYLVCVDSDGCAMDTMDIKHIRCFGPCMVAEWGLEEWRDAILERWNEINLYTMTRGINRFKGLVKALREIEEKYCEIEELNVLEKWVNETPELSNAALEREISQNDNICLRKALAWSNAVNQSIDRLPEEDKRPFPGVLEALKRAYRDADIAIVSSANLSAVLDEWDFYGLLEYTDVVLAQDSGSKAFCIGELMKRGYAPDHVLMCGDAPGDLDAAERNGVYYYPILVRHEAQSWEEFVEKGINHFLDGTYDKGYQQEKKEQFLRNLGKE